jgi:hypothetical protein
MELLFRGLVLLTLLVLQLAPLKTTIFCAGPAAAPILLSPMCQLPVALPAAATIHLQAAREKIVSPLSMMTKNERRVSIGRKRRNKPERTLFRMVWRGTKRAV